MTILSTTPSSDPTSPIVNEAGSQTPVSSPIVQPQEPPAPVEPASAPAEDTANNAQTQQNNYQKRINDLVGKRHEAERRAIEEANARASAEKRAAELQEELAKHRASGTEPSASPSASNNNAPRYTEQEIEQRALEKAREIARMERFNEACNAIADAGAAQFKDAWKDSLGNLGSVGILGPNASPVFLELATDLKEPAKVIHHLGLRQLHLHPLNRGGGHDDENHQQHIGQVQHGRDIDVIVRLVVFLNLHRRLRY